MIDIAKAAGILAELAFIEERMADRGPIKLLPRPAGDAPDIPALENRRDVLFGQLKAKRNYAEDKAHDLDGSGKPADVDLSAVGTIECIKTVAKGDDSALPAATTLVQVGFPDGEHLWFDPSDLEHVE